MDPPPGFVRLERDGAELVLLRGLEDALLALGIADPDALVARSPANGVAGRGALARLELPGGSALLRLYRRGGLLGKVVRRLSLDGERARAELALHARARERGAPVVEAVAAITRRRGAGFEHALATREVAGARDLQRVLGEARGRERRRALALAGEAVRALHDAGVEHADLNVKNVLVAGDRAFVIDLDRGELREALDDEARRRNLIRLLRSALKLRLREGTLESRDALRFARAYARGDRSLRSKLRGWGRAALPWIRLRSVAWKILS
ncbi:MAG TPA: lipopolysaccharide kinase InaA family protein [Planctomycetota bacterium]|nr:lipopolysaccharide kinase InaA family protein [Planctomycetota bacterium]